MAFRVSYLVGCASEPGHSRRDAPGSGFGVRMRSAGEQYPGLPADSVSCGVDPSRMKRCGRRSGGSDSRGCGSGRTDQCGGPESGRPERDDHRTAGRAAPLSGRGRGSRFRMISPGRPGASSGGVAGHPARRQGVAARPGAEQAAAAASRSAAATYQRGQPAASRRSSHAPTRGAGHTARPAAPSQFHGHPAAGNARQGPAVRRSRGSAGSARGASFAHDPAPSRRRACERVRSVRRSLAACRRLGSWRVSRSRGLHCARVGGVITGVTDP